MTEYGKCRYRDNQLLTMQELPETAPPGQLPYSSALLLLLVLLLLLLLLLLFCACGLGADD